jgi:hypothetical protein
MSSNVLNCFPNMNEMQKKTTGKHEKDQRHCLNLISSPMKKNITLKQYNTTIHAKQFTLNNLHTHTHTHICTYTHTHTHHTILINVIECCGIICIDKKRERFLNAFWNCVICFGEFVHSLIFFFWLFYFSVIIESFSWHISNRFSQ